MALRRCPYFSLKNLTFFIKYSIIFIEKQMERTSLNGSIK
nr:MAG TPA: hypothetical protein [Caudoviricetes sp.]